jgi:hypothetical protein
MIKAYHGSSKAPVVKFPLAELTKILCFNDEYHTDGICRFFELKVVGDLNKNATVIFDRTKMPIRPEAYLMKGEPGEWRQVSVLVNQLRGKMTRKMIVEASDEGVTPESAAAAMATATEDLNQQRKETAEKIAMLQEQKRKRMDQLKAKMQRLREEKAQKLKEVAAAAANTTSDDTITSAGGDDEGTGAGAASDMTSTSSFTNRVTETNETGSIRASTLTSTMFGQDPLSARNDLMRTTAAKTTQEKVAQQKKEQLQRKKQQQQLQELEKQRQVELRAAKVLEREQERKRLSEKAKRAREEAMAAAQFLASKRHDLRKRVDDMNNTLTNVQTRIDHAISLQYSLSEALQQLRTEVSTSTVLRNDDLAQRFDGMNTL